ncbi:DNA polymerase III subunit beta [Paenibacillus mendelii]|uniref:Beta sliding clamp n=1 Tax=Paenibacillus mendelii TaxID=206163 RepID=A0ABV6J6U4_9BACL|nr:DNA polymerase III subunit beta [Paenibacillus mendelii]MCQ6561828.1 DNA polymerase III subunit beta [Paenibacillus mendelii]
MRISASQDTLHHALQNVMKAVSPHCLVPILSGIKLTAHAGGLSLSSSNTHMMIQYELSLEDGKLEILSTGSIVVPAAYLSEIVRKSPSEQVTLEVTEHLILTIRAGSSVYRLCGMDPLDFPGMPEANPSLRFAIPSPLLHKVIKQVVFAVSASEHRPVLTGVSCQLDKMGRFRFLATDGIRFASRTTELSVNARAGFTPITIPGKNLNELAKLLLGEQGTTEVALGESWAIFKTGNVMVYSALIEGTYPSVENFIPASPTTEVLVHAEDLIQAIERVTLLADKSHLLRFHTTGKRITLTARTAEIGDVSEELIMEHRTGADIDISFNGKYMRDILRSADSPRTTLKFTGRLSPIHIEPYNDAQTAYILTPIRTQ